MKTRFITLSLLAGMAMTASAAIPISEDDFVTAAESTVNGVVSVKSYATPRASSYSSASPFFNDPFFEFFFGSPQPETTPRRSNPRGQQQQTGLGSGVIISPDGYIVTNNHVIEGAERLEITLNDNRSFEAAIVGADPVTDLALVKIDAPADLHVIPMGNSEDLRVGQWVLAVGNPFGFTSTVTSGIVSAKARNISSSVGAAPSGGIEAYIQTDAAVNQGNSGGALVDLQGRLVGINTAIYSRTGNYAGCSFAIPTSIVRKVVDDIMAYGTVQRAVLGISFIELTPELISSENLTGATRGILVAEVQPRSAASEAGILARDIVTGINGTEITGNARMQEIMARCSPGDTIEVTVVRDGKALTLPVILRNRDGNTDRHHAQTPADVLGATFAAPEAEVAERLEIRGGAAVTVTGDGRFRQAGIRDGFIILSVNNRHITEAREIEAMYKALRLEENPEDRVMFISGIYPSGKRAHYAVDLAD